MNATLKKLCSTAVLLLFTLAVAAQNLYVGSYNIRYKNSEDAEKGDIWAKRCQVICDQLNFEAPDIFGAQEVLDEQLHDMLKALDGYAYIGVGRDDGKKEGEYAPIFYRTDKLTKLKDGHFWLSQTPETPSLGWDAACVRICTWGLFKDNATAKRFYFFNLHTDHVGAKARREASKLVIRKMKELASSADGIVLTGDFNVDQDDEVYRIFTDSGFLSDAYAIARHRFAENGTFNDFDTNLKTDSRIDHIFVSKDFEVPRYGILTNCYWTEDAPGKARKSGNAPQEVDLKTFTRRSPSDHYPVFARLQGKPGNASARSPLPRRK